VTPQELDTSSIRLVDPQTNTLVLTAQTPAGNWEVNTRAGTVTLTPNPVFSGNASLPVVIETTAGEPYRVVVSAPVKRCDTGPNVSANVYFDVLSAKLTKKSKATLRDLVRKATARGNISCAVVRGYVQPVGGTANDKSLSRARALAVSGYLQELGIGRVADVQGVGRADETGSKARRATARVFVQVS
jgi:outer membrane protein OmpA-like peptidoglycan-associated protein